MDTPKDNKEERDVLVEQARDAMQRGDRVMAIALLTQAIVNHPDNAEAYQLRGRVRYETGDIRGAKEDAEKMLQLDPQRLNTLTGDFQAEGTEKKARKNTSFLNPHGL